LLCVQGAQALQFVEPWFFFQWGWGYWQHNCICHTAGFLGHTLQTFRSCLWSCQNH